MRLPLIARGLALLLAAGLRAGAAQAAIPTGLWLTQHRDGVIEITACGDGLCGRIVGMNETRRPDGGIPTDPYGQPICGLAILQVEPDGPDLWAGHITDPDTGSVWNCTLRLDEAGNLLLRGYVLLPLLGQTQTWTRYTGQPGDGCTMPE